MTKNELKPGVVIGRPNTKDPTYDMLILGHKRTKTAYLNLGSRAGNGGRINTEEILNSSMVVKESASAIRTVFEEAELVELKLMATEVQRWLQMSEGLYELGEGRVTTREFGKGYLRGSMDPFWKNSHDPIYSDEDEDEDDEEDEEDEEEDEE